MAGAYAVFANGGYKISPYIISKITDTQGKILAQARPDRAGVEENRVIDERNAFLMDSMLKDVVKFGTATRALVLNRPDIAGKTGTTNDSIDAWFSGYNPKVVGVAWIGFDQPKNLGNRETGGGVALPIWIGYMQKALKNIPVEERAVPEGVIMADGDRYRIDDFPLPQRSEAASLSVVGDSLNLDQLERQMIERALRMHHFNVSLAASELGLSRGALYRRMEKHGL